MTMTYFLPRDLVPWPTYLSMLHTGTADPLHMWTKFGEYMSKRSWVMLEKWTDKQTNGQTNILSKFWQVTNQQTNILAKNCKFWQVTNRQTNILAKNCKFWQVTRALDDTDTIQTSRIKQTFTPCKYQFKSWPIYWPNYQLLVHVAQRKLIWQTWSR